MNDRARFVRDLEAAIGRRRLVWFGTRGEDARPLLEVEQFHASFAITARLSSASLEPDLNLALEDLTGRRVDLDVYEIDDDRGPHMRELRRRLLSELQQPCVVLPYRPSGILSAAHFATRETATLAGMFKEVHRSFEHKPWVETSLTSAGVEVIPWRYFPDELRARVKERYSRRRLVLRRTYGAGGVGMTLTEGSADIEREWLFAPDAFVSVAPFYDDAISFNVGACVYPDGTVSVHPASVQLVGVPGLSERPFGYCGNDFAAMADAPDEVVEAVEAMTLAVGRWLHSRNYLGAFGIDAIWAEDRLRFVELNPRFQGSTWVSSILARKANRPDLLLEQLAAWLGVAPPEPMRLADWIAGAPPLCNIVVHQPMDTRQGDPGSDPTSTKALVGGNVVLRELRPNEGVEVDPGACAERVAVGCTFDTLALASRGLNAVGFTTGEPHSAEPDGF